MDDRQLYSLQCAWNVTWPRTFLGKKRIQCIKSTCDRFALIENTKHYYVARMTRITFPNAACTCVLRGPVSGLWSRWSKVRAVLELTRKKCISGGRGFLPKFPVIWSRRFWKSCGGSGGFCMNHLLNGWTWGQTADHFQFAHCTRVAEWLWRVYYHPLD